jgi:hypothetical protein
MKKQFVSYVNALKLKQLGFTEKCFGLYKIDNYGGTIENPVLISVGGHWGSGINISTIDSKNYSISESEAPAPFFQQVLDWFREKHNLHILIETDMTCEPKYCYEIYKYSDFGNWKLVSKRPEMFLYLNYHDNLNEAIKEAIKLIEK